MTVAHTDSTVSAQVRPGFACRAGRFARRSWRVLRAVWAFARARCPKWLVPVLVACAFIPGPLDELAVLAVIAWPMLRSADARRELGAAVRGAWRS